MIVHPAKSWRTQIMTQAPDSRRARRKVRLADMEVEMVELCQQDKASRKENAALARQRDELQVPSAVTAFHLPVKTS